MWLRYWGKTTPDYSAMRWPCPKGFHIMSSNEFMTFLNKWETIWAFAPGTWWYTWSQDANNIRKYMKIPPSSYMKWTSWTITHPSATNWYWWLWFCKTSTASQAPRLQLWYGSIVSVPTNNRSNAYSIRAVKDVPVAPDSSWTMTYDWSSTATWAWIYWNSTLWLISISADWSTWMTISDKNVWATTAYNESMTLNEIKTDAVCWLIYQRWNCQWVSAFWTINTSSTQVDASAYWPSNYYLSGTFITWSQDWSSVRNDNLRWWVTWIQQRPTPIVRRYYWWKMKTSYSAMRWPCPEGFHVPTRTESQALYNAVSSLWLATTWDTYKTYLKIPIAWYRLADSTISASSQWSMGYYRLCTYKEWTSHYPYRMRVLSSSVSYSDSWYAVHWYPIRPFKDEPVIPDSWRTTLYTWTWSAWIFHNSTLWLISISSDWNTRITIADKNAWATTVYNSWDTLSQSNCWNYYQRWNNYWFPRTWTISNVSSTQVNTTGYWPWNLYSDSTYRNTASNDWFNPVNPNLRWWVTGTQQRPVEILKTYYWNTLIWEKP